MYLECFKPKFDYISTLFKQSVPIMFTMLMIMFGVFNIFYFVGQFGELATAGYGTAVRIEQVLLLPVIGLNTAVLSIAGQNYGAKMHPRSIELGLHYNIPIMIKSSLEEEEGTLVCNQKDIKKLIQKGLILNKITENRNKVSGVTSEGNISKITLKNIPDKPGIAAKVFEPLSATGINVDVIVQNASNENKTDLTFTVDNNDLEKTIDVMNKKSTEIKFESLVSGKNYGKISIIGSGIQNAPGYAAKFFDTLSSINVNIEMITTSDIRITCLVKNSDLDKAIIKVHEVFGLDK